MVRHGGVYHSYFVFWRCAEKFSDRTGHVCDQLRVGQDHSIRARRPAAPGLYLERHQHPESSELRRTLNGVGLQDLRSNHQRWTDARDAIRDEVQFLMRTNQKFWRR